MVKRTGTEFMGIRPPSVVGDANRFKTCLFMSHLYIDVTEKSIFKAYFFRR